MEKKNYSVEELSQNHSFRRMVYGTATQEETEKWNRWMEASEENRRIAREAIAKIAGFTFSDTVVEDIEKEWSRLYKSTLGRRTLLTQKKSATHRESTVRWIYRVAAVLVLVSTVGIGVYFYGDTLQDQSGTHLEQMIQEETVQTAENQRKTLKFSNGSQIVLNGNSLLAYRVDLLDERTIRVTLEGEAFFESGREETGGHPAFSVETPHGVIEDIGTKFIVKVGEDRSRVVLDEGIVKVETDKESQSGTEFYVNQGELVEFSGATVFKKQKVNTTFYTAWSTGSIEFDRTRISEFAAFVEERFQVDVVMTDSDIADITIDGAVYFKSLEDLVLSVSDVTNIAIYQSADKETVFLSNNR